MPSENGLSSRRPVTGKLEAAGTALWPRSSWVTSIGESRGHECYADDRYQRGPGAKQCKAQAELSYLHGHGNERDHK